MKNELIVSNMEELSELSRDLTTIDDSQLFDLGRVCYRRSVEGIIGFALCVMELKRRANSTKGGSTFLKDCQEQWGLDKSVASEYNAIGEFYIRLKEGRIHQLMNIDNPQILKFENLNELINKLPASKSALLELSNLNDDKLSQIKIDRNQTVASIRLQLEQINNKELSIRQKNAQAIIDAKAKEEPDPKETVIGPDGNYHILELENIEEQENTRKIFQLKNLPSNQEQENAQKILELENLPSKQEKKQAPYTFDKTLIGDYIESEDSVKKFLDELPKYDVSFDSCLFYAVHTTDRFSKLLELNKNEILTIDEKDKVKQSVQLMFSTIKRLNETFKL